MNVKGSGPVEAAPEGGVVSEVGRTGEGREPNNDTTPTTEKGAEMYEETARGGILVGPLKPDADGQFAAGVDGAVFNLPPWFRAGETAGTSTCPMCGRTWTVTPHADCMMPACGCYGDDASAANPARPCESCGLSHAWRCGKRDSA